MLGVPKMSSSELRKKYATHFQAKGDRKKAKKFDKQNEAGARSEPAPPAPQVTSKVSEPSSIPFMGFDNNILEQFWKKKLLKT